MLTFESASDNCSIHGVLSEVSDNRSKGSSRIGHNTYIWKTTGTPKACNYRPLVEAEGQLMNFLDENETLGLILRDPSSQIELYLGNVTSLCANNQSVLDSNGTVINMTVKVVRNHENLLIRYAFVNSKRITNRPSNVPKNGLDRNFRWSAADYLVGHFQYLENHFTHMERTTTRHLNNLHCRQDMLYKLSLQSTSKLLSPVRAAHAAGFPQCYQLAALDKKNWLNLLKMDSSIIWILFNRILPPSWLKQWHHFRPFMTVYGKLSSLA